MSGFTLPGSDQDLVTTATSYQNKTGTFAPVGGGQDSFSVPQTSANSPFTGQGANSAASGDNLVAITPPLTQIWGIYTLDGNPLFDVDTCVSIKFSDNSKVSTFPVESGSFAAYNKVASPFSPKVRLAVGGQHRISMFMDALSDALRTTDLYNLIMPEKSYLNVTLEKYDYARTAKDGKNLLQVDLTLVQVIEVTPQYSSTKIQTPKAKAKTSASKQVGGKVQPVPEPTIEQKNGAMARQLTGNGRFTQGLVSLGVAQ